MMTGDLSELLNTRKLSATPATRRYSTFLPITPPSGFSGARRLSILVPESVSRRLSNVSISLGLGKPPPPENFVEQGKALCALYMRSRIRGSSTFGFGVSSKVNTVANLVTPWAGTRIVFPRLSQLGKYIERTRPRLYTAIARHGSIPAGGGTPLMDPADIVYSIGMELFKDNITWGKIVSVIAVCGTLASEPKANVDLVSIIDAMAALIKGPLTPWIAENGGWYGLAEYCQPAEIVSVQDSSYPATHLVLIFFIVPFILLLIYFFGVPTFYA